jgi:beta-mannosidase
MEPERWPELDWDRLVRAGGMQKEIFDRRVPPVAYPTFEAWRAATQEHQATLLRHHVEALRRLKYRPTGGFCQLLLADGRPAVSGSVLDHERVPKPGFAALQAACAPVIVTADRPDPWYRPGAAVALDVHVVSDLRQPLLACVLHASLTWPGGSHRWGFKGAVPADAVQRVGTLSFVVPDAPGPLTLDLRLEAATSASTTYRSEIVAVLS